MVVEVEPEWEDKWQGVQIKYGTKRGYMDQKQSLL
jgi:hypothetical protein